MRKDIAGLNPVQLEDAKCGCERWEVDGNDPMKGAKLRSVVCLHVEGCLGVDNGKVVKAKAKK